MRERTQTTVILTKKAQEVKDDLSPIFGLKNILSAGLIVFGRLTSDEQKQLIAEANSVAKEPSQTELDGSQRRAESTLAASRAHDAKQKQKKAGRRSKAAG